MGTPFENMVGTLICAVCEAAEDRQMEAKIEVAKSDALGVDASTALRAAKQVSQDRRVEMITAESTGISFRFTIQLFADAFEIHDHAVAEGRCPSGLKNEVVGADDPSPQQPSTDTWTSP